MDPLREPYARRGEMWDRAEHAADTAGERLYDDHPQWIALVAAQHREIVALMGVHTHERIRLAVELRRQSD